MGGGGQLEDPSTMNSKARRAHWTRTVPSDMLEATDTIFSLLRDELEEAAGWAACPGGDQRVARGEVPCLIQLIPLAI